MFVTMHYLEYLVFYKNYINCAVVTRKRSRLGTLTLLIFNGEESKNFGCLRLKMLKGVIRGLDSPTTCSIYIPY